MKKLWNRCAFGAVAIMGGALWLAGCSSTPKLTKANAAALLQAEYDKRSPQGVIILVDNTGLRQGLTANYWKLTRVQSNKRWADYALTSEGKKVLRLPSGGEVIQWRPGENGAFHFYIVSMAANHLKVRDVQEPVKESLPGTQASRSSTFTECVSLDGVPQPLQEIAHNPGNKFVTRRQAEFALVQGAWTIRSIN